MIHIRYIQQGSPTTILEYLVPVASHGEGADKRYSYGPDRFTYDIWDELCSSKAIKYGDTHIPVRYAELHVGGELKDRGRKIDFSENVAYFQGDEYILPQSKYPYHLTEMTNDEAGKFYMSKRALVRKRN